MWWISQCADNRFAIRLLGYVITCQVMAMYILLDIITLGNWELVQLVSVNRSVNSYLANSNLPSQVSVPLVDRTFCGYNQTYLRLQDGTWMACGDNAYKFHCIFHIQ